MTPLIEFGEMALCDGREGGKDYLLRPSFSAMTRIGQPDEIVKIYAEIHGAELEWLPSLAVALRGDLPAWLNKLVSNISNRVLSVCMQVMQACCEDDLSPVIGYWEGTDNGIVYQPGLIPRNDIVIFAQQLMQHGIIGKAKVRRLQRHESNETVTEFRATDYINAARGHFGMPRDEAADLTMTEFQLLIATKYPEQKGFTKEEYDSVADEYLRKKADRLAKAKAKKAM